ncbi:MAG: glutamine-hydrolyzing GMP synthase [Actinomycetes bacterium]|jgi:GMP synthase (glutamine-hydrolysing)|nr:glutamine-hydrolyzing GMP synthase [Actinomycetes bacterium]
MSQHQQQPHAQHAHPQQPTVLVLDFGAQYAQLIARRVREARVYSEIVPATITADAIRARKPAALILTGGPASVFDAGSPHADPAILQLGIPMLGFCYGIQEIAHICGGRIETATVGEYGPTTLIAGTHSPLFADVPETSQVWMSHRDSVVTAPDGFTVTATTANCAVAAMEDPARRIYATQFHPEVAHTEYGQTIIENFLYRVAGIEPSWTTENIAEQIVGDIRAQVGDAHVLCALSGGVDSSVVAALLHRAIGDQLTCVFVDHGLLRAGEAESVDAVFRDQFHIDLVHVDARERYLSLLAGVTEPEQKRRIIGREFWKVFFEEAGALQQRLGDGTAPIRYLAQGTLYPDLIESGTDTAAKIKSHHNLIPFPPGVHFDLIEPLKALFKDEVRALGAELGLPDHIVWRQPFPGPGLAVRIIGEVTEEKLAILRAADAIVRAEIDAWDSERSVWQYFAVLPDIRSVGVMGDERTYARPVIVRAVSSADAMTADWARLPADLLARMSNRIINEVAGVNRVAYDITSKPPGTIEWE